MSLVPGDLATELTELLAVDVSTLSVGELTEHMARLERARSRFEARVLGTLAVFDRSGAWQIDAAYNAPNWLAGQTGAPRAVAGSRVRLAGHLQLMPETAKALAEGSITDGHARALARCVANPRVRDAFPDAEPALVEKATSCTADQLTNVVDAWIELTDQDGGEPRDPQHDTVSANRVGDRVKVNADLGLETGIPFLAALEERAQQLYDRDKRVSEENPTDGLSMRTPGMRRAEALTELVAAGSGAESNPRRREPLFLINIDPHTMRYGVLHADSLRELCDGTVIPIRILNNWKCGAQVSRVVMDARKSVLYLGRTERYANREQRRALAARDRGCAVPGCDRPPAFCDAHHVVFWDNAGKTDIDNLVLLCRHHHRMIHAGRLRVEMVDGVPRFFDSFDELLESGRRRSPQADAA